MLPYHPLKGIRVIEFCWIWAGPFLGQFLADLGAEVIKIEWYKRFDPYRTRGIEQLRDKVPGDVWREMSPSFHGLNRNKVGFTVNLKSPDGVDLVKRLAAKSDLLIENWTSGTLESLGLGVDALKAANPKLVVVALSAFGARSRLDGMRSYGLVTSALSGAESMIQDGGELCGSPTFVMSDPNAALFGLFAAIASLRYAKQRGKGVAVTVSQLEAMFSLLDGNDESEEVSSGHQGIYETADGKYMAVSFPNDASAPASDLAQWCKVRSAQTVLDAVRSQRGCAEVLTELVDTPKAAAFNDLEVRLSSDHPVTGSEELVAAPWRVNGRRPPLRKTAPTLGEGNRYVLGEILGLSTEEMADLQGKGVV